MNRKQQIVLFIAVLSIAACLLYVPWRTYVPLDTPQGYMAQTRDEYRLVNSPPEEPLALKPPQIVWMYQTQKVGLLLAVNAFLLFVLRSKKTRTMAVCTVQTAPQAAF